MCVRRSPDLSRELFDSYWCDHHGPLVRRAAEALRIKRYVQVVTLPEPGIQERLRASRNASVALYDGYAELWWDSIEDLMKGRSTEEGAKAIGTLIEDERKFIDLAHSQLWLGTERAIISGSTPTSSPAGV
jgi:hypothetical protein